MTELNNRTLSALSLGVFIIALATGIVVYAETDKGWLIIVLITALAFGLALCLMSCMYNDKTTGAGPSDRMYRLAVGAFVALVGLVGVIYTMTSINWIYSIVILIVGMALIGMMVALINNKKEASQ